MISRRPVLAATTLLVGAVLALSGCTAASAPAATDMQADDAPLQKYLIALLGDRLSDEEIAAGQVEIEEIMASCMAEEGFDYVPVDHTDPYYKPDEWLPDDPDWVAQWGYGVTRFPGRQEMLAAQAEGDENTAYYESLSASEQSAYSTTLYGPPLTDEELAGSQDGSAPISREQQGCYGKANHEVLGDDPLSDSEHTPLRQAIQVFQQTQFAAADYSDLNAEWADCMADAGLPDLDNPAAAKTSISDELTEIYYSQTESDEDDPRILALHDEEVEMASADLACREKTDFKARSWAIQVEQEKRFIADHQEEFDALEADAAQGN